LRDTDQPGDALDAGGQEEVRRCSVSERERRHEESEGSGVYGKDAGAVRVDVEAQERELVAAGWERLERVGKIVWRNPRSGHLYPQGAAIALIRAGKIPGASEKSGEE
jgi:hypothetical protein